MSNGAKTDSLEVERVTSPDIAAKEEAVARAELAFSASIHDAEAEGRGTLRRATFGIRPVLIGVGLLAGVGVGLALVRRSSGTSKLMTSESRQPSGWSNLGRAMALAFAAAAGRRLVEGWLLAKSAERPRAQERPEKA